MEARARAWCDAVGLDPATRAHVRAQLLPAAEAVALLPTASEALVDLEYTAGGTFVGAADRCQIVRFLRGAGVRVGGRTMTSVRLTVARGAEGWGACAARVGEHGELRFVARPALPECAAA